MGIAAVPRFLSEAAHGFQTAPPGHRFSLYLEAWNADFTLDKEGKNEAFRKVLPLPDDAAKALEQLRTRQLVLAQAMNALVFDAIATAPFATGLGMEHPLENGFAFLNPHGLPYLPGSGVKGVLRETARQLADGAFGGTAGWTHAHLATLFGSDAAAAPTRGALSFWDVIPGLPGKRLRLDIMTPHQTHYYQDKRSPHDSGQPTPIAFLTVPPKAEFRFIVSCEEKYLGDSAVTAASWRPLLQAAFEHAYDWLGFGAKTAVGYGAMARDAEAENRRETETRRVREEADKRLREEQERQRLAALSPAQQEMAALEQMLLQAQWQKPRSIAQLHDKPYALLDALAKSALAADSTWTAEDRGKLAELFALLTAGNPPRLSDNTKLGKDARKLINRLRGSTP